MLPSPDVFLNSFNSSILGTPEAAYQCQSPTAYNFGLCQQTPMAFQSPKPLETPAPIGKDQIQQLQNQVIQLQNVLKQTQQIKSQKKKSVVSQTALEQLVISTVDVEFTEMKERIIKQMDQEHRLRRMESMMSELKISFDSISEFSK
ncbi:hypothetical protein SS50377_27187 [Spironucleus salmonicida]|uniref:Uncharacterized protein n=1 Tax=Spironucleus salmonicida TaxID=348837 RepID=V6LYE1_9EUKA|nr:hypothetical protein SS50377_27187 [Spironucleus salmonicida]|eukprot:EST49595.1 Hypothetical protein SS50377_10037 [Spironucleus salmonicida]